MRETTVVSRRVFSGKKKEKEDLKKAGALSLQSRTETETILEADLRGRRPPSYTVTLRVYSGVRSRSRGPATKSSPVEGSTSKAESESPEEIT